MQPREDGVPTPRTVPADRLWRPSADAGLQADAVAQPTEPPLSAEERRMLQFESFLEAFEDGTLGQDPADAAPDGNGDGDGALEPSWAEPAPLDAGPEPEVLQAEVVEPGRRGASGAAPEGPIRRAVTAVPAAERGPARRRSRAVVDDGGRPRRARSESILVNSEPAPTPTAERPAPEPPTTDPSPDGDDGPGGVRRRDPAPTGSSPSPAATPAPGEAQAPPARRRRAAPAQERRSRGVTPDTAPAGPDAPRDSMPNRAPEPDPTPSLAPPGADLPTDTASVAAEPPAASPARFRRADAPAAPAPPAAPPFDTTEAVVPAADPPTEPVPARPEPGPTTVERPSPAAVEPARGPSSRTTARSHVDPSPAPQTEAPVADRPTADVQPTASAAALRPASPRAVRPPAEAPHPLPSIPAVELTPAAPVGRDQAEVAEPSPPVPVPVPASEAAGPTAKGPTSAEPPPVRAPAPTPTPPLRGEVPSTRTPAEPSGASTNERAAGPAQPVATAIEPVAAAIETVTRDPTEPAVASTDEPTPDGRPGDAPHRPEPAEPLATRTRPVAPPAPTPRPAPEHRSEPAPPPIITATPASEVIAEEELPPGPTREPNREPASPPVLEPAASTPPAPFRPPLASLPTPAAESDASVGLVASPLAPASAVAPRPERSADPLEGPRRPDPEPRPAVRPLRRAIAPARAARGEPTETTDDPPSSRFAAALASGAPDPIRGLPQDWDHSVDALADVDQGAPSPVSYQTGPATRRALAAAGHAAATVGSVLYLPAPPAAPAPPRSREDAVDTSSGADEVVPPWSSAASPIRRDADAGWSSPPSRSEPSYSPDAPAAPSSDGPAASPGPVVSAGQTTAPVVRHEISHAVSSGTGGQPARFLGDNNDDEEERRARRAADQGGRNTVGRSESGAQNRRQAPSGRPVPSPQPLREAELRRIVEQVERRVLDELERRGRRRPGVL